MEKTDMECPNFPLSWMCLNKAHTPGFKKKNEKLENKKLSFYKRDYIIFLPYCHNTAEIQEML